MQQEVVGVVAENCPPILTDPKVLAAVARNCQENCQLKACRQDLCQQCQLDPSGVTVVQLWEEQAPAIADYVRRHEQLRCGPVFWRGSADVTIALEHITGNRGVKGFFISGPDGPWDLR